MKKLINLNFTGVTRGIPLMKQYRNLFIILTVALFLTACGGGGGTTLSTSSGGGNGGGSTTNPNPPVVQKDIATLVMEAETAVGAIDDTTPTQDQVDAANTAIMAANAAIGALEDGDDKTTYMGQIDALEPTVTVAGQRVSILTAIKAAEMAVEALGDPPYDEVTQAQIDAAQMAIGKIPEVLDPAQTPDVDQMEKTNEYTPTFTKLNATLIEVRQFINADLNTAAMAKTAAGTGETDVTTFAAGSTDITAIVDGQTISVAMGVSEDIGTSADITTLNADIAEIEKQLLLAERAKDNLDDAAVKLRDEIDTHKKDLDKALQGTGDSGDTTNEKILKFIAAADQLESNAWIIEGFFEDIEAAITQLRMDIASETDPTMKAQKQKELNDITMGMTRYSHQLPGDQQAMFYTYADLKDRANKARTAANNKKAEQAKIEKLVMDIDRKELAAIAKEGEATDTQDHITAIEGVLNPLITRFGVLSDVDALQSTKAGLVFDLLREPLAGAGGSNTDSPLKAVTNAIADLGTMDHVFARFNNPDEAVTYVDYGMWLEGTDDALMLERRIGVVGPNQDPGNLDLGTDGSNTHTSATYEGEARGLSARTKGTRDDAVTASGHFIADVELNVEFGATAELAGTIDEFRAVDGQGGDHVDDDWSLELRGAADGNNEFDGRYFRGGSGHWTATPYGATNGARPAGFYGGFNAVFSDNDGGAAAGVYSTKEIPAE